MTTLREAAQQALEALDGVLDSYGEPLDLLSISGGTYEALQCREAITALRAALAEPVQELTIERLRNALVASRIIPPAAVEDPDEYDDGVTLFCIEALHRRIT